MTLARTLMVQGTASSAGKSFVTTALCRYFANKGVKVAPFKALNMALNAYVTADGLELARAQAVQAEASRVELAADMNPILLKPEPGSRSQLVLHGRAVGSHAARELFASGIDLRGEVQKGLDSLRKRFELVILEGAGSPAEVNLRARDVANMFAARAADAKVLLVGDIDRGGVLASFVGTLSLLEPEDRARVGGLIVNKFRGDRTLLVPGLTWLHEHTGVPVLSVLPHMGRHGLAEEDSLDVDARTKLHVPREQLDVYVLRLPHLSNHDEFQPLEHEPGVSLAFGVDLTRALEADLVIVPGSKSTVNDLAFLRAEGFDHVLALRARRGQLVLGICGGCQMLGREIHDEHGVESSERITQGLGLLPLVTHFAPEKRTERVRVRPRATSLFARDWPLDATASGYFIHAGRSHAEASEPLFEVEGSATARVDGARSESGVVLGTMVHGLFEDDGFRARVLTSLRAERGLEAIARRAKEGRSLAYDRVAEALAAHSDMRAIEALAGF